MSVELWNTLASSGEGRISKVILILGPESGLEIEGTYFEGNKRSII